MHTTSSHMELNLLRAFYKNAQGKNTQLKNLLEWKILRVEKNTTMQYNQIQKQRMHKQSRL